MARCLTTDESCRRRSLNFNAFLAGAAISVRQQSACVDVKAFLV